MGTHLQHRVKLHFPINLMDRELPHEGFARTDRVPGDGLVRCTFIRRKGREVVIAWKGYPSKGVVGKACGAHEVSEANEIGDAGEHDNNSR